MMMNIFTSQKWNASLTSKSLAIVSAGVCLALSFHHLSQSQTDPKTTAQKPAGPAAIVTTAKAKVETVPVTQTSPSTVIAMASVTIKARVDGQLEAVKFTEGQEVKAGQLLAVIDARPYQAQYDQAAALKAKDEALVANAEADLKRYTELIKDEATTQQTLDTQRALVKQLKASLMGDEAQLSFAKVQLGYTQISAPISGRIGARLVDAGNIVHAADPGGLLVINQIDPIALQFTLPESAFQQLSQAMRNSKKPLKVEALDRVSQQVLGTGEVILLNNQIDTTTGTISLKAKFANSARKLWPGQSLTARITLGELANALTVPTAAIQRGQDGLFVYVIDAQNVAQIKKVHVVQSDAMRAVVDQGLAAGDRVVIDGQYRLAPGSNVVEAKPAVAPAASASASGAKP